MLTELGFYVPRIKVGYLVNENKKPTKLTADLSEEETLKFKLRDIFISHHPVLSKEGPGLLIDRPLALKSCF